MQFVNIPIEIAEMKLYFSIQYVVPEIFVIHLNSTNLTLTLVCQICTKIWVWGANFYFNKTIQGIRTDL